MNKWTDEERKKYLHDISNLVLTKDNSRYSNFEFDRKSKGINDKGNKIYEFYYSNSDIKQERKIAHDFEDWTPENCKKRRVELTDWIIKNWGIDKHFQQPIEEIVEDDEDITFNDND